MDVTSHPWCLLPAVPSMAGRSARCCYAAKETGLTPVAVATSWDNPKTKKPRRTTLRLSKHRVVNFLAELSKRAEMQNEQEEM